MSSLICKQLTVSIGNTLVCQDLDLTLQEKQCWALLGKNGSGKTTLIHTLAGLRQPQQGSIQLQQQALSDLNAKQLARQVGVLFQNESDQFPSTVLEYTLIGRHPHLGWLQWESQQDIDIAEKALQQVDLLDMKERDINTLSGGERRRMNIACLLTQNPDIALLDEPGNHLDLQHQIETLSLIRQHYENRTLLMSAHDINLAVRYCTHALLLFGNGETIQGPLSEILTTDNLQRLYGIPIQKLETDTHTYFYPH